MLYLKITRIYSINEVEVLSFTCGRNSVHFDYPMVENIKSILPIVNEFDLNVRPEEDNMLALIQLGFEEEGATTCQKIGNNLILWKNGWRS